MYRRILSDEEIEALYGQPRFSPEERAGHFALSPEEKATLELLRSARSQVFFILQLGYFKARRLFFDFGVDEVREDVCFIQACYFPGHPPVGLAVSKATRLKHQQLILSLFNYRHCHAEERQALSLKARQAAMVSSRPVYICQFPPFRLPPAGEVPPRPKRGEAWPAESTLGRFSCPWARSVVLAARVAACQA